MRLEVDFTAGEVDTIRAALRCYAIEDNKAGYSDSYAWYALDKINRATRIETVYAGKYIRGITGIRPEDARQLLDELGSPHPEREPMTARLVKILEDRIASCEAYVLRLEEAAL